MIERPFNAAALCETARKLAGKLEADVARNINEATTIEKYVNPVLEELGWRLEDDRRVAQFAVQGKGAVDIALLVSGEPQVLVEAKRLR